MICYLFSIDTFKDLMAAYEEGNLRSIKNLGKVQYGEILAIIDSLGYRKENKVISNPYIHSRGYHVPREIEKIPIDNMNLENRLRNVLYREGYRTVGKIMRMKKESLHFIHEIGDKSIDELMKAVKRIEKEGIEYFTAPDRTNEPIKEDDLLIGLDSCIEEASKDEFRLIYAFYDFDEDEILYNDGEQIVVDRETLEMYRDDLDYLPIKDAGIFSSGLLQEACFEGTW